MPDAVDTRVCLPPRLCWLPLQRCANTLGEVLGGVVLMFSDGAWVNIETTEVWPGDPFVDYVGAVELGPVTR